MKKTRFKCAKCGKLSAGRIPARGDASFRYPRWHIIAGKPCAGNYREATWVDVEIKSQADQI